MPTACVTDANIWVSHYISKDANHQVSRAWISTMVQMDNRFVAPEFMVLEVTSAVARQLGSTAADTANSQIRSLQHIDYVPLDDDLFQHASHIAISLRLRSADRLNVALADRLNLPLVTWDQEIHQRAGDRIRVLEPT